MSARRDTLEDIAIAALTIAIIVINLHQEIRIGTLKAKVAALETVIRR